MGFRDWISGRYFTISNSARVAILPRLVELNQQRGSSEVASERAIKTRSKKKTTTISTSDESS